MVWNFYSQLEVKLLHVKFDDVICLTPGRHRSASAQWDGRERRFSFYLEANVNKKESAKEAGNMWW